MTVRRLVEFKKLTVEVDCPPSIVKLADAQHHAQWLATFYRQPIKFYSWKNDEIARHTKEAQ